MSVWGQGRRIRLEKDNFMDSIGWWLVLAKRREKEHVRQNKLYGYRVVSWLTHEQIQIEKSNKGLYIQDAVWLSPQKGKRETETA